VQGSSHHDADAAPPARGLAWGFAALCTATFGLLVLGALVRVHGAGLACPDWPLCFGRLVPAFDVRVAFEWGHRLVAGLVSLGLVALSAAILRRPALRSRVRGPLAIAWSLLGVQVVLGGLTVLLKLAPWTVTAHLLTGTGFCATLLWIARDLFETGHPPLREPLPLAVRCVVLLVAATLVAQLGLGGMVSSHAAGLACAQFPSCDGTSLAPTLHGLIGLHVLHRLNGALLLALMGLLVFLGRRSYRIASVAWTGLRLVLAQIAVGALNVLLQLPAEVTALHSALAAAIALTVLLLVRESVRAEAAPQAARRAEPLVAR
jgi:heme A synthase